MSKRVGGGRDWPLAVVVFSAAVILACRPTAPGEAPRPAPAAVVPPALLAEGRVEGSPLIVQITGVTRPEPEVLEIALALVNEGQEAASVPAGQGGATGAEWLAGAYLVDERHQRFYVMRGMDGRPKGTDLSGEIAAGSRRSATARFPAPHPGGGRVTAVLPRVPPLRGIPIPAGTPAAGPSY